MTKIGDKIIPIAKKLPDFKSMIFVIHDKPSYYVLKVLKGNKEYEKGDMVTVKTNRLSHYFKKYKENSIKRIKG